MSKVQGKDVDLLNNLAESGIANELDSRLRDLEKNIAVAREFIKLADESYSELRRKWNLLQEEARGRTDTAETEQTATPKKRTRSPKKESVERVERSEPESKTNELEIKDFEEFTKAEPSSRSRNKSGKDHKTSEDPEETFSSQAQFKSAKQSRDQVKRHRKGTRRN